MIIKFILYTILTVSGVMLFKAGSDKINFVISNKGFTLSINYLTLIGVICYVFSFFMWLVILKESKISYILPLATGMVNILIVVLSFVFLNETLSIEKIISIGLIILGIILLNINKI